MSSDDDFIDLKGAHIDHLALRIAAQLGEPMIKPISALLPAAVVGTVLYARACRLYGYYVHNADVAAGLLLVGHPDVTLTTAVSGAACATPSAQTITVAGKGIVMQRGLAAFCLGASVDATFYVSDLIC